MVARKKSIVFLLLVLTLGSIVGAYVGFKISDIQCQIESQACPIELSNKFDQLRGQSMFFFDEHQLMTAIQDLPAYQIADYSLKLPHTLVIQIKPQTVAYIIKPISQEKALAVTQEGHLLSSLVDSNQFQVLLPDDVWSQYQDQSQFDSNLHQVFTQTIADLQAANISASALYWQDSQTIALFLPDKPIIILDPAHPKEGLTRLKLVLAELANNPVSAQVQEIDVRFKLPVLRQSTSIPRHTSN